MFSPEKKPTIKIAGYLEKKGKMKVVCRWKRWWFVLEGRLLLYYKSQLEYINLSPCRGSLNLGLASSVKPGKGLELLVVTRSQTITLRAGNRIDHEQWLQSLVDAMALQTSTSLFSPRPVLHFRYCNDLPYDHKGSVVDRIMHFGGRSYTLPSPEDHSTSNNDSVGETASLISESIVQCDVKNKCVVRRHLSFSNDRLKHKQFDRSSIRHSKIAFSDTSIPLSVTKQLFASESKDRCQSLLNVDHHEYVEIDVSTTNIPVFCFDDKNLKDNSGKIHIKADPNIVSPKFYNDEAIENNVDVHISVQGCENDRSLSYENNLNSNFGVTDYKDKNKLSVQLYQNKEAKSDSDLSMNKNIRTKSGSIDEMNSVSRTQNTTFLKQTPTSDSMARKDSKAESEPGLRRRGTLKKRSISFLRKVWRRREKKNEEQDYEVVDYDTIPASIEKPTSEDFQVLHKQESHLESKCTLPAPEPPPDYDLSLLIVDMPPVLPPRQKRRPHSPWHDVPTNNMPVLPPDDEPPPALPEKKRNKNNTQTIVDVSVTELSEISDEKVKNHDTKVTLSLSLQESNYDVPRPHTSLLNHIRLHAVRPESITATNFFCSTPIPEKDSLDSMLSRFSSEVDIAPDSLECDTEWSLDNDRPSHWSLSPNKSPEATSLQRHFITSDEKVFEDSLNT